MGFINKYALAIKLVAFGLLVVGLFAMKAQNASLKGKLETAEVVNGMLTEANKQNERVIEGFSRQRLDNDAIAAAVTKRLESNRARTETARQGIRNAQNDPSVRAWADTAVPIGVRNAIEAPPR